MKTFPILYFTENWLLNIISAVKRLQAIPAYVQLFNNSFGVNSLSIENVSKAIASFERSCHFK